MFFFILFLNKHIYLKQEKEKKKKLHHLETKYQFYQEVYVFFQEPCVEINRQFRKMNYLKLQVSVGLAEKLIRLPWIW